MSQLFDEAELLDRVDHDREFLQETVEMLVTDGPALLEAIRQAIHAHDAAAVSRAAHTLKGVVSNFSAPIPHEAAFALERAGKAGDLSGSGALLADLQGHVETLIEQLQALVAKGQ